MATQPSRRALLGVFAVVPAVALSSVAAASILPSNPLRRRLWDNAMADYLKAALAHDSYYSRVWEPAYEMEEANYAKHGVVPLKGQSSKEYWSRRQSTPDRGKWCTKEIDEKVEQLCNASCDAESHLHTLEAPDQAALLWKMENIWQDDSAPTDALRFHILSDLRRLMGSS